MIVILFIKDFFVQQKINDLPKEIQIFSLFFHPFVVLLEFGSGFKSKHYSASNSSNSSREEL